jgi:hypothetical protein
MSDVTVNENSGPQTINLTGISCGSANAGATLKVAAVSSNPNLIQSPAITYSSPASTATLTFLPNTNTFGTTKITVSVTDSQPTNNSAGMSFNIVVTQIAIQPGLLTNGIVAPNNTFRYLLKPPVNNNDNFSYSLGPGAPLGAKIVERKGISWFTWTPPISSASTTNIISIKMTDLSNGSLSTNQSLEVTVLDYVSLVIGSTALQAGQNGSVPLSVFSSEGITNLSFTVAWPTNLLANPSLSLSAAGVAASSVKPQGSDLLVTIQMAAGQTLLRSNLLGSLAFQPVAGQPSGYINLPVGTVTAVKPTSQPYVNSVSTAGQVAVVNNLAILQAVQTTGPTRRLTVLGRVGNTYQIQYCTNLGSASSWMALLTYTQTSVSQTFNVDSSLTNAVYRVQQK